MAGKAYIPLTDIAAYKHARTLSQLAWDVFDSFDWRLKKVIGDQMIRSVDSVGANIAEGYGRYHYLDKTKFYYYSRGSLLESRHWFSLLYERNLIDESTWLESKKIMKKVGYHLNQLINSQKERKNSK